MGCGASVPIEDENDPFLHDKQINDMIEQSLHLNKQNSKKGVKLLLLGAGESGKSTVLKQLKLLHKGGFSQQERMQYSQIIWCDVLQSMKILIIQARKLKIPLDCDKPNNPLIPYKQCILRSDALTQIDTTIAGGNNFLNDYILKYDEKSKNKRKMNSTGVVEFLGGDSNKNKENSYEDDDDEELDSENLHLLNKQQQEQRYSRQDVAEAIHKLWTLDSGIKKCYERSNEFQFESSADYYFNNVFNFADPTYLSSDLDILKGRIKTTGITETNFTINSFQFKVLDAGGQRSERKKWIHCFDDITAVLFVLAINEYDQMLFEDERVNRMHESIILFDQLCNSNWFKNTPFILFLNKIDIFEKKIQKNPIKKYFPDYNGKNNDFNESIKFFETNFLKMNRNLNRPIYIHRTCATDTNSMKFVLSAVADMIIQQNLKKSGIM
ncbi:GPA1 [Candida pseudojiufengensis]|uniref:GPA1 n=1 Tax=Candida pseudojiufengensis TaxID=497109 RepID=UPI0022253900|nr:GPA1 [Candida pseudojiufengensis]KAI5964350.1 GPA1 [Candida pseudojiufengensis]